MSVWGKIIGGGTGMVLGGPLGAVLGLALGHKIDKVRKGDAKNFNTFQEEINDKEHHSVTLLNLGYLYWKYNQKNEALDLWTQVYHLTKQIEKTASQNKILKILEDLAQKLGHSEGLSFWGKRRLNKLSTSISYQ